MTDTSVIHSQIEPGLAKRLPRLGALTTDDVGDTNSDHEGKVRLVRWTDAELAVALDRSLTAREAAAQLPSRSAAAVQDVRSTRRAGLVAPGSAGRAPWSDDELAVALDRSLTAQEAAQRLGRSLTSVRSARAMRPNGVHDSGGRRYRWTDADMAVVLDESLTTAQAAARLGRSVGAVYYARRRYGRAVPADGHGTLFTWRFHGCTCDPCREFGREYQARSVVDPVAHRIQASQRFRQRQEATIPGAHRRGDRWTVEDIAIACDPDLATLDAARMLGRTASAIAAARHRYKRDGSTKSTAAGPRRGRYSALELAIALDRTLSLRQAAEQLGRSVESIEAARARHRS